MKTINVSQLKAHLSKYLRLAAKGSRIVVQDRNEPIAQLGPLEGVAASWRERLAREGRLRRGTQEWKQMRIARPRKAIDVAAALRDVREDNSEIRRR
jgi:antitoxin (DNA-binding transcriptional repressor) of toxin-antitoxin stability system